MHAHFPAAASAAFALSPIARASAPASPVAACIDGPHRPPDEY